MNEADPRLMANEEIVFRTSKHWAAMVADSGAAVLLVIGSLVVAWLTPEQTTGILGFVGRIMQLIQIGLFLGGVGWIVYNLVAWRSADYFVTNQRVLGTEGLLRRKETDSLLTSISDVRSRSSAVGRRLGYGDVRILSASGEAGADSFTSVRNADDFKKRILEEKVKSGAVTIPSAIASDGATAPGQIGRASDVLTTLAILASLRDAGTITPDEFESKKSDLLARI